MMKILNSGFSKFRGDDQKELRTIHTNIIEILDIFYMLHETHNRALKILIARKHSNFTNPCYIV